MQHAEAEQLSSRAGPRPRTTTVNPHMQLDQQPGEPASKALLDHVAGAADVVLAPSRRAPPGTVGIYLTPEAAMGPPDAFMLGAEFAHVHPHPDHSLHMTLPEPLRRAAIDAGWAEPHPMAGQPTVSRNLVLIFAPRDAGEVATVNGFLSAAADYARGRM